MRNVFASLLVLVLFVLYIVTGQPGFAAGLIGAVGMFAIMNGK